MAENEKEITAPAKNPLGSRPIGSLLLQFSIPGVISMLVSSLYNIVDQVFIGNFVGELGNAATNIAFPLSILSLAISLLFGMGGGSAFNLAQGRGEKDKAPRYLVNAAEMLFLCGLVIGIVTLVFLTPLLRLFGSPDDVLPYAQSYVGITAFGYPFYVFSTGCGHLIRADGRPRISMVCMLSGAFLNIILDTLFVAVFGFGISGAALATIIGQIVAGCLAFWFFIHPKTVKFTRQHVVPKLRYILECARLGMAPCLNQLAAMVVQITMNNQLNYYGGMSIYGEAIPIAVVGIITKVNQVYLAVLGGIAQGVMPIASFNYGARKYHRTRDVFIRATLISIGIGFIAFLLFQIFPRQIIDLFGSGSSDVYYEFAVRYFRTYLFLAFINFLPQLASNFFTAIGKPFRGTILSLTRQIIFFLPLLVIFPMLMGIDGIMYVGPVADALAVTVSIVMLVLELRNRQYWPKAPKQDEKQAE